MVYEARDGIIYDANGFISGTCNSDSKPTSTQRKKGLFRPLRKLSDAFKKSPAQPTSPELAQGDFRNGFNNSWISVPQERWTRRRSNSNSKLEKSRSLSDISLSFASAKPSSDCKIENKVRTPSEVHRRFSAPSKPVVLDAKAHVVKPNKEPESKQQQDNGMRSSETRHKPARKRGDSVPNSQHRARALAKLNQELSSKQILPNKTIHIKGFPPQAPKTKETTCIERTSPNVKTSNRGLKNLEAPAKLRHGVRPRAQSLSLTYPQKLNINFLDEEDTSQAEACKRIRPHSRSLPNTSSVFFVAGGSQNELEFVELNRKLDRVTLQASASVLNEDGMSMLHKAAQNGFTVLTKFLVNNGVSMEMADSQGWSPLCVALDNENFECAEVLVRLGANVNFAGHDGRTILHKMASLGNYKAVEFLISCQVGLDIEDHHGWPALHYAFRRKKLKCAALLMSSGADVARYTAKRVQEYSMATEIIKISRCRHDLNADHEC